MNLVLNRVLICIMLLTFASQLDAMSRMRRKRPPPVQTTSSVPVKVPEPITAIAVVGTLLMSTMIRRKR